MHFCHQILKGKPKLYSYVLYFTIDLTIITHKQNK